MKIEVCIEDEEGMKKKPSAPTAFQKKVATMLAKQKGKKAPDEYDFEKARELEEED
jgi:hypothetical protein